MSTSITNKPLCIHPFIGFVVNPGKNITPCCAWNQRNEYIGSINKNKMVDMLSSKKMIEIKTKLLNNQWPAGCSGCYNKEKNIQRSMRTDSNIVYTDYFKYLNFDTTIRRLEFAGSNICNLACVSCNEYFSSRWTQDAKKLYGDNYVPTKNNSQQVPELIIDNLKLLDLSHLETIHFKGGEPMLNEETLSILEYLDSLNILKNINVIFTSNGTISNSKILGLISGAKHLTIDFSIDGDEHLNSYIRYPAPHLDTIEDNIRKFTELKIPKNIKFHPTIMAYNIFNLIDMDVWYKKMKDNYHGGNTHISDTTFQGILMYPAYLRVNVLSDNIRKEIYLYYDNNLTDEQKNRFRFVMAELKNPYAGDTLHNEWVDFTKKLEKIRNNSLLDVEPRFHTELVLR